MRFELRKTGKKRLYKIVSVKIVLSWSLDRVFTNWYNSLNNKTQIRCRNSWEISVWQRIKFVFQRFLDGKACSVLEISQQCRRVVTGNSKGGENWASAIRLYSYVASYCCPCRFVPTSQRNARLLEWGPHVGYRWTSLRNNTLKNI